MSGLKHLKAAKIKLSNVQLCKMTDAAIEGLKDCKCSELTMSSSDDSHNIDMVVEGLAQNTSITKLSIVLKGQAKFGDDVGENVARLLEKNNMITDLEVHHYLNDFGFQMICKALLNNNSLMKLDLSACCIKDNLSVLGDTLFHNTALKVLNLLGNCFYSSSMDKFCEALTVNTTMHTLNLGACSLPQEAMLNLAAALHVNRSLTDLDISLHSSDFTQQLYLVLLNALKNNNALKTVTMRVCDYCPQSVGTLASFTDLIKTNTSITRLTLDWGMLASHEGANISEFIEALKENSTLTTLMCGPFTAFTTKQADYYSKQIFEKNYSLIEANFFFGRLCKYLKRNKRCRRRVIANTMVMYENIFRSQAALDLLPPELWMRVFAHLSYPGIDSMAPLIENSSKYNSRLQKQIARIKLLKKLA